ncbi:MAG: hypothetical protein JO210_02855 [Acidobacteriaceae bacterium]|nr:hypothetical protein [Acidobacteriaceae bacterium]
MIDTSQPARFGTKITRANRASRHMQFAWWGEIVAGGQGARLLGLGASGTFRIPKDLLTEPRQTVSLRIMAINANGKAYELDRVYELVP